MLAIEIVIRSLTDKNIFLLQKKKTKGPSSGNFLMIDGCSNGFISHVKVLDWPEKKKMSNSDF